MNATNRYNWGRSVNGFIFALQMAEKKLSLLFSFLCKFESDINSTLKGFHPRKMTKKDLADIALKIFGLFILDRAFYGMADFTENLIYYYNGDSNSIPGRHQPILFVNMLVYLAGFWVLTFKTPWVISKLFKNESSENLSLTINKTELLQVLYSAAGIIISFLCISEIQSEAHVSMVWDYSDVFEGGRFWFKLTKFILPIIELMCGLSLIFFSGRLARFMTRDKL